MMDMGINFKGDKIIIIKKKRERKKAGLVLVKRARERRWEASSWGINKVVKMLQLVGSRPTLKYVKRDTKIPVPELSIIINKWMKFKIK